MIFGQKQPGLKGGDGRSRGGEDGRGREGAREGARERARERASEGGREGRVGRWVLMIVGDRLCPPCVCKLLTNHGLTHESL